MSGRFAWLKPLVLTLGLLAMGACAPAWPTASQAAVDAGVR